MLFAAHGGLHQRMGKCAKEPRLLSVAETMARQQREISVSEFFTKNRHLLGFDNPRKALLTAIKEGVDNSLDACEEAKILPEVDVVVQQVNGDERFRIVVEDNGPGIVRSQIPRIFGSLLYGSKFHRLKMARGQQGIGISAAGMYGQLTTGKPIVVTSRTTPNKPAHYYEIQIDTQKNQPRIVCEDEKADWTRPTGTRVEIELEAKYLKGRQSVDEYLELTALANPHLALRYVTPQGEEVRYERSTEELPPEPREIRPHPHGIELGMLINMLHATRSRTLKAFLCGDFSRVSPRVADVILEKAGLAENARPSRIARDEAETLLKALRETKIMNPPTDCIAPIGQERIIERLRALIEADFYTAVTRPPTVYRGNPFQIEVGLAYGGSLPSDQAVRLLRFANRVPLLYQQSACAFARATASIAWRHYGLQQQNGSLPVGPMVMFVHIASVWVPFTSESKEAIAHYPEILREIRLALQYCGRQLGRYVRRERRMADALKKKSYIESYIPHIGEALKNILALSEAERGKVEGNLKEILERSRGI